MSRNGANTGSRSSNHPTRREIVAGGVMLPVASGIAIPHPAHLRRDDGAVGGFDHF